MFEKVDCIWKDKKHITSNGCLRVDGYVPNGVCGTNLCEWAQSRLQAEESKQKARRNFMLRHGFDGYDSCKYVPRGIPNNLILSEYMDDRKRNAKGMK